MICPPCKEAGRLLLVVKSEPESFWTPASLGVAERIHTTCQFPSTCTCQHDLALDALQPGIITRTEGR